MNDLTPPEDYDLRLHDMYYKKGKHGYTYRWSWVDGWVKSSATLSKIMGGGWGLTQPNPVPRVYSDFALPASSMTKRGG